MLLAHRFVSDYAFGKIRFWSLEGRHQGIAIVSVGPVLLFKLSEASQSVIVGGEEIEGLTAKVFRGGFDLVRTSCSFPVNPTYGPC